jgi:PleD family two-component response regulator
MGKPIALLVAATQLLHAVRAELQARGFDVVERTPGTILPIIFVAECRSEELAIAALKAGVTDYFKWPFQPAARPTSARRQLLLLVEHPEAR